MKSKHNKFLKSYKDKSSKKAFIKDHLEKGTFDFRDTSVAVDAVQHAEAEKTANKALLNYLKESVNSDLEKIPFAKGILTLYKKEAGLYSGFFEDRHGQISEKFDDMTLPILAKNMEVRELYDAPPTDDYEEAREIAQEAAKEVMEEQPQIRIKYGDFELEIRKSLSDFAKNFKKTNEVRRLIKSWRRNNIIGKACMNDIQAAKELSTNWSTHKETFYQIIEALKRAKK